jgi:hypothetical protein
MRTRSMGGVLALVSAVAVIGAGTAFAQTPVVPATAVAPSSADKPNADEPKADKPKAEEPKADKPKAEEPKPDKPKAEEPKADKPKAEEPKADKPKPDKPKPDKPKPDKPKPDKPKAEEPKPEEPKAEEPKAEQPTAEQPTVTPNVPKSAQPQPAQANAPSAQPNEPAPEAHVEVTMTVSPSSRTVASLAASGASAASPEPLGTDSASSGGDSADAIPVAGGPAAVVPRREPRVANDDVTAAAAVPVNRQQPRLQTLDSRPGYNVQLLLPTLLLAIVFAVGLGYHIRRELRGSPSTAALRRHPSARALQRRPKVHAFQRKRPLLDWLVVRGYLRAHLNIAREYALTTEKAFAHGFLDLRSYSRAKGAHLASRPEATYDRARRFRTTVGDRLRTLVAERPSRRP